MPVVDPVWCMRCSTAHTHGCPLDRESGFYDPLKYYEYHDAKNEGWDLIREMVGLDKGPDEEEYVEWNERALAFLTKHGKL